MSATPELVREAVAIKDDARSLRMGMDGFRYVVNDLLGENNDSLLVSDTQRGLAFKVKIQAFYPKAANDNEQASLIVGFESDALSRFIYIPGFEEGLPYIQDEKIGDLKPGDKDDVKKRIESGEIRVPTKRDRSQFWNLCKYVYEVLNDPNRTAIVTMISRS